MELRRILSDEKLRTDIIKQLYRTDHQDFKTDEIEKYINNWQESVGTEGFPKDLENIIKLVGRPVLEIRHNTFVPPLAEEWHKKLSYNRVNIENAIPAVGRVELREHPRFEWLGTGWMVAKNILVTNRHIAEIFAEKEGSKYNFKYNFNGKQIQARIDFREEYQVADQIEFSIDKVLYIEEPDNGENKRPDLAFLQISLDSNSNTQLPEPIELSEEKLSSDRDVVVIGYPARDSRVGDLKEMERIFGSIYDVKRMAPGVAYPSSDKEWLINHDCSTLGGNSGSVVLDIETGKAVGIHYGGRYLDKNYAVSSTEIIKILNSIK
ncbi:trypsin-like serine peptidase [Bacillus altitudinis]|uniref:trypsin-like serine peptidase n=1 Tax=Bacillus TaxID=1386 RepID=UPI0021052EFA|nr:serine protease [Bacillus sp. FS02]